MTKEQALKRRRARRTRLWAHDCCLCRKCAPGRREKYLSARLSGSDASVGCAPAWDKGPEHL